MKRKAGPVWIDVTDGGDVAGRTSRLIELRRPAKLNCLSLAMLDELLIALEGWAAGPLILTGVGRSFCAGLDLQEVAGTEAGRPHLERLVRIYDWFLDTPVSTIVLARGHAAGGGAGLAACARRVIAAADFRVRIPGGSLARLAAVVVPICRLRTQGRAAARQTWLGCDLDAAAARRLGLVDEVIPAARLGALIRGARSGVIPPEWLAPARPNKHAVARARLELKKFLQAFPGKDSAVSRCHVSPRKAPVWNWSAGLRPGGSVLCSLRTPRSKP
jgi:isohexenylglutaconyl-CoA hydratase